MATVAKPRTITFLSEKSSFLFIRRSQGMKYLPDGNSYNDPQTPEIAYQFQHGHLTVEPGQDMLRDDKFVTGDDGLPAEQDAASWIRQQPDFGVLVHEVAAIAPPSGDILGEVALAAAAGDTARLIELGNEEAANWNRTDVIDVIAQTLERLDDPVPEPQAAA